jgi:dipeptidyl aminopeptidase/acylaminoacyl peptidase
MRRILLCLALAALAFAQKRPISESDLYAFKWVADPRILPDGTEVAFTQVSVTPKHDNYQTSIWIVPATGGPARQLTSGTHDSAPRWSPDGKRLAFLRTTEKDGKPEPAQLFVLDMAGGEARALTDLPKGAGPAIWSPSGRYIAFNSSTLPKDFAKSDLGTKEPAKEEEKSDVRVINRAAYRSNGQGYTDFEHVSHIWTVEVPAVLGEPVKAKQITQGKYAETSPVWSKDESLLYFTSDRVAEPYYEPPQTDIYAVDAKGGEIRKLVHVDGGAAGLSLSPDGTHAAFVSALRGNPVRSYSQPDLFVTPLTPGATPKNLTADYDFDIGGGIGGDQSPPRGSSPSLPYWSNDGRYIFVTSGEKGRSNLKRVDVSSGKVESVTEGDHDIYAYSATPNGAKAALLISDTTNIGDVFVASGKSSPARITHVNETLLSQLDLSPAEEFSYRSFDGKMIQGFIQKPPQFDASRKYPLILNIHGGPHSAYGFTFFHEMQWMAAKGYVVLYPNPRGSTTFGQDFGNIIQYKYPGDDYKDLMAGVDAMIAKGYVDADRTGVTGGSGGGILTNWTITQTNRFKAAVAQRSIADWTDFWYTADFTLFTPTWFRGAPWQAEADFKARSPITYVEKIQTPLMLVEGEADFRCPPGAGGEQMFRALKYLKKPVVMIQFPGESHELSRSGKPVHRIERLRHIVGWFDKYLQGKPMPMYDIATEE